MITNNNTNVFTDIHHFVDGLPYVSTTTDGDWTIYNLRNGKHIAKCYKRSSLTLSTTAMVNGFYIAPPVVVSPPTLISCVVSDIKGGPIATGTGWAVFFGYRVANGDFHLTIGRRDKTSITADMTAEITVQDFAF